MFVREKRIGAYRYLYLVETVRENGRTKQRIIRNLGRKEMVEARGDLDRLARSAARLSQRSMILSLIEDGGAPDVACRRIGAPLLFERLWQESGCHAVVEGLLAGRRFEFAVERAVFLTVLHRLMVSGSDRACEHWRNDYRIDGIDELELHHLYHHGSKRQARVLGDVARQYRRRHHTACRDRPPAPALCHWTRLRRGRSWDDQYRNHRRPRGAQTRVHIGRARAQHQGGARRRSPRSRAICAAVHSA